MPLPAQAQGVYAEWWSLVQYAMTHTVPGTDEMYTASDLSRAVKAIADAEERTLSFADYTGIAQLYGIARSMERAADVLTLAGDGDPLIADHVSTAPWARDANVMAAAPKWQLRIETTYRAPDGTVVTTIGTGIFSNVLPVTVGDLRNEAQLQMARYLSKRNEEHNTGGELLSLGRMYLMAV